MTTFIQHDFPKLMRIDSEGGRTYKTPTGEAYPSVTSVVGLHSAQSIQEWRQRIGFEEANMIASRASKRGTAMHSLCEDYLKTGTAKPNLFDREMFNSLRPYLDRIDNVHCLETQLYSHHLQVAGTVDCIAEFDGKLTVIDFKTSSKAKKRDWIHNYFMQTSAYAVMFEELTGIPVNRLLIIMGVDEQEPLLFHEKRNDWIFKFRDLRAEYKQIKGI
jgi:genome maintenance exonuclease 1